MPQKEPKYDLKAGRQIFDKEYTRDDKLWVTVPKDTENPIDIKLRQLCLLSRRGEIDIKANFFNKWAVAVVGEGELKYAIGRIKDLFIPSRHVYLKTRQGKVYIVSFDRVIEVKEREPV